MMLADEFQAVARNTLVQLALRFCSHWEKAMPLSTYQSQENVGHIEQSQENEKICKHVKSHSIHHSIPQEKKKKKSISVQINYFFVLFF